jgi:hypothetical protein
MTIAGQCVASPVRLRKRAKASTEGLCRAPRLPDLAAGAGSGVPRRITSRDTPRRRPSRYANMTDCLEALPPAPVAFKRR